MRVIGWLASALGVAGIVAGNGLASVVWVLKLNLQARLQDVRAVPEGGLDIATTLSDTIRDGLTEMSNQIVDVQGAASRLAHAPAADEASVAELGSAIDAFASGPYATFRTVYQRLRQRAIALGDALNRLGKSVPAATLPPAAVERLQTIDTRMLEVDASVTYLSQLGPAGLAEPGAAQGISERAAQAQESLGALIGAVSQLEGWIVEARDRLAERERHFNRMLNLGAVVVSVGGLLFAGLNVLLFQQGRRWSSRR